MLKYKEAASIAGPTRRESIFTNTLTDISFFKKHCSHSCKVRSGSDRRSSSMSLHETCSDDLCLPLVPTAAGYTDINTFRAGGSLKETTSSSFAWPSSTSSSSNATAGTLATTAGHSAVAIALDAPVPVSSLLSGREQSASRSSRNPFRPAHVTTAPPGGLNTPPNACDSEASLELQRIRAPNSHPPNYEAGGTPGPAPSVGALKGSNGRKTRLKAGEGAVSLDGGTRTVRFAPSYSKSGSHPNLQNVDGGASGTGTGAGHSASGRKGGVGGAARLLFREVPENVGMRLAKRKQLFERRQLFADLAFVVGIVGLMLAVMHVEFDVQHVYGQGSELWAVLVTSVVTLSSFALALLIGYYHVLEVRIKMIDNCCDKWALMMGNDRLILLALEMLFAQVHPWPGVGLMVHSHAYPVLQHPGLNASNASTTSESTNGPPPCTTTTPAPPPAPGTLARRWPEQAPIELSVLLTLPMFARVYLGARCLMLHSRLFEGAASQILGPLNRIQLSFGFVFKAILREHTALVLASIIASIWLVSTWSLHACESHEDPVSGAMANMFWLTGVTFLTIGSVYLFTSRENDMATLLPRLSAAASSACYAVSACSSLVNGIGLCGAACTALLVAMVANKLELSLPQQLVHQFVDTHELQRAVRMSSARIMWRTWMVHKAQREGRWFAQFLHERSLMHEIAAVRKMKAALRAMKNDMADLGVSQEAQAALVAERLADLERLLRAGAGDARQSSASTSSSSAPARERAAAAPCAYATGDVRGGGDAGCEVEGGASALTADRFAALEARFERIENALNVLVARK